MERKNQLYKLYSLSVFDNFLNTECGKSILTILNAENPTDIIQAAAKIKRNLLKIGETKLKSYISDLLSRDENALSLCIIAGKTPDSALVSAAKAEIAIINSACAFVSQSEVAQIEFFAHMDKSFLPDIDCSGQIDFDQIISSYRTNGCGVFAQSTAFMWDYEAKKLVPISLVNSIRLDNLKDYEDEKLIVVENTKCFLKNLPANNVLLYGDRGTGKSSTIHAVLNEFSCMGLRLIELNKAAISQLFVLLDTIRQINYKFIIFIDDLSFSDGNEGFSELKAALEGSIIKPQNVLIYATSNRRHLIKESFSDRNEVHSGDTLQEQLSLSDRFGIVVTFSNPNKDEFANILKKILLDRKITVDDDVLLPLAEKFCLKKGGRSPRAAKQLADIIQSKLMRGIGLG